MSKVLKLRGFLEHMPLQKLLMLIYFFHVMLSQVVLMFWVAQYYLGLEQAGQLAGTVSSVG